MKVALVTEIPAPYRISPWNELAATRDVELLVLLLGEADPRRGYEPKPESWQFQARVLPGVGRVVRGRWIVFNRGVGRELRRFEPDVVIVGGWNQPAFFQAARAARRAGAGIIAWIESTERDARPGNPVLERLKRRLVSSASGFVVPGHASRTYVVSFGVGPEAVVVAPNAAEPELVRLIEAARVRRDVLRAEHSIEGACFLSVGRLVPEKGHDVLLRAFDGVPGQLVIVGDGPKAGELRDLAPAGARLLGTVSGAELADWYAAADAFVLASRSEPWGIVVNEAASAGLPLVVTDAVGAAPDLVEQDVNGLVVPAGDEAALRDALVRIARDAEFRERAAARSRRLAAGATPRAWADAVARAARNVVTPPTAKAPTGRPPHRARGR